MSHNYAIDSKRAIFDVTDDDEMESAFLNSGTGSYNLNRGAGNDSRNIAAAEEYRTTIQKLQDVEQRTLDSTKRSLQAIAESEQIGVDTAKDLVHQREQLINTNRRLDNMNADLQESQKNIKAMGSIFSTFRQWITTPKGGKKDKKQENNDVTSPSEEPNFDHNPALEKAVNIAPLPTDPSLRLRGVDYSEPSSKRFNHTSASTSDDWKESTKRVNKQLDDDLDEMAFGLSRLKGLAEGLNTELTGQEKLIDDINMKADKTGLKLNNTNKQVQNLLKK